MQLLARHSVREYWLVDPESASIEVHSLTAGRFALASAAEPADRVQSRLLAELVLVPRDIIPADDHR